MANFVSTLQEVRVGKYRWAFLLVAFSDYASKVREEMKLQSMAFAADLRLSGLYVQPFDQAQWEVGREVLAKPWPDTIADRMNKVAEPVLIVIENDFAEFDPREHRWAIVWLSDVLPGREEIDLRPFLKMLASTAQRGDDVIGALKDRAERNEQKEQGVRLVRFAARAGSYIEWNPRLPLIGLGVDLKAVLRDLAHA